MLEGDGESLLGKTVGFLTTLLRDKVVEDKEAEAIKKLSLPTTSKAAVAFEEMNEADSYRGSFHRAKGRGTGLHEQGRDSKYISTVSGISGSRDRKRSVVYEPNTSTTGDTRGDQAKPTREEKAKPTPFTKTAAGKATKSAPQAKASAKTFASTKTSASAKAADRYIKVENEHRAAEVGSLGRTKDTAIELEYKNMSTHERRKFTMAQNEKVKREGMLIVALMATEMSRADAVEAAAAAAEAAPSSTLTENEEDATMALQALVAVKEKLCGQEERLGLTGVMTDASDALHNAIQAVLAGETVEGALLVCLNCYYHVVLNIKKADTKKKLINRKAVTGILADIWRLYVSRSQGQYEALFPVMLAKWSAAGESGFAEYFRRTYLTGRFSTWNLAAAPPSLPLTDNPLESFNSHGIKEVVDRNRATLSQWLAPNSDGFLHTILDGIDRYYTMRTRHVVPCHLPQQDLIGRIRGDTRKINRGRYGPPGANGEFAFIRQVSDTDTTAQYRDESVEILTLQLARSRLIDPPRVWYMCDCENFHRNGYMCDHNLAVLHYVGLFNANSGLVKVSAKRGV
ncbi:hypothetical protein B484DRAFT_462626, partial [Ochromonadaceae sp. CCMP2298]